MSTTRLTTEAARQLLGKTFVYDMPFNRELGLELLQFASDHVQLTFSHQDKLVGNSAQHILHGGVIAAVLDVAAGLVCVGHTLTRHEFIDENELRQRLAKMGTIDLRVDYLRPGRGEQFIASAHLLRAGNKVAVARVELHNQSEVHIATATATYLIG